jgi:hypothetical protein
MQVTSQPPIIPSPPRRWVRAPAGLPVLLALVALENTLDRASIVSPVCSHLVKRDKAIGGEAVIGRLARSERGGGRGLIVGESLGGRRGEEAVVRGWHGLAVNGAREVGRL